MIEFYAYRQEFTTDDPSKCSDQALDDIMKHRRDQMLPVGSGPYVYSSHDTYLVMFPREELTWQMWTSALGGIDLMLEANNVEFQFIIIHDGIEGDVGYGAVSNDSGKLPMLASNMFP